MGPSPSPLAGGPIRAGVITVSDGVASGHRDDVSGRLLREMLQAMGARVEYVRVVPDEMGAIQQALLEGADGLGLDLLVTTGGTGLGPRDVTPETTMAVIQKGVPGLAEAMRWAGLQKTPLAMLSRAVAGVRGRTLILNLPGSPRGVRESLEAVADQLPHAIALLRGEQGLHPSGENQPAAPR